MKIKVCGVTREKDIEALLSVNIDYIGFNFIKSSPRKVSADWALDMSRKYNLQDKFTCCLLYTSPSPRDRQKSRMPSSA